MVLETGIFASQFIWLWRVRHARRQAKKAGLTYDEYIAEHPSKKLRRCDSSETVVDVEACHDDTNKATDTEKQTSSFNNVDLAAATSRPTSPEDNKLQAPPAALVKSDATG